MPKLPIKKKYIATPAIMWNLFIEYRDCVKSNPFEVIDWVGGAGKMVKRQKEKPLTIEGLENYCSDKGVISDLGAYFANNGGRYKDYITICARIRKEIRQDQIEGGMAGLYNNSITQRLNGLKEQTDTTVNTNINILSIDPLSDAQINNSTSKNRRLKEKD